MSVTRDYSLLSIDAKNAFSPTETESGGSSVSGQNTLLQGSVQRTSIGFGRTATVKAGEDIRPALESLKSAGGGTLILLAGLHTPAYDIVGGAKINIVGEGVDQTIIDFNAASYGLKYIGTSGARLSNFTISDLTVRNSSRSVGFDIRFADFFILKNLRVTSCTYTGVQIESCKDFSVELVTSDTNGYSGFFIPGVSPSSDYTQRFSMSNCVAEGNGREGFYFYSLTKCVRDFTINLCRSIGNTLNGFYVYGGTGSGTYTTANGSFNSCFAEDNLLSGFNIAPSSPDICLLGCRSLTNGEYGVFVGYVPGVRVIACIAGDNTLGDFNVDYNILFIGNDITGINIESHVDSHFIFNGLSVNSHSNRDSFVTRRDVRWLVNGQAGGNSISAGHVVIFDIADAAAPDAVCLTTTVGDDYVVGVASGTSSSGGSHAYVTQGKVNNLKVNGTTDIAVGDFLCTYSVAGIAAKAAAGDMAFAIALEAYTGNDSNGVIDALVITPRKL